MADCTHLDTIELSDAPQDVTGCQGCPKTGHPIVRIAAPGVDWTWCCPDSLMFRLRRR